MKLVLIAEVVLVAIVQLGLARGKYVTSQHGDQQRDVWLDDFDKDYDVNDMQADTLGQFLRGLSPVLKTLVMTQSPEKLADAAQMAMVAESVNKELVTSEKSVMQSSLDALTTGLQALSTKLDDMQSRLVINPIPRQPHNPRSTPLWQQRRSMYAAAAAAANDPGLQQQQRQHPSRPSATAAATRL